MKKIVLIIAIVAFVTPVVFSQSTSDTSYHLFFYKGKKIKDDVLLTPQGDTVSYNPSNGKLKKTSKGGTGKQLDNMLTEANKTPQRINQMMQKLAGSLPKPVVPYYAKPLKDAYEEISDEYKAGLSNTIEIPKFQAGVSVNTFKGSGPPLILNVIKDEATEKVIEELQSYIQQHLNDNIEVPVPPTKDYRYCSQCDKEAKKNYKRACHEFHNKLIGEESQIAAKLLSVERYWALECEKKPVVPGTVEYYQSVHERLNPVLLLLMKRSGQKAKMLLQKFGNNPMYAEAAITAALTLERQKQIMGVNDDESMDMNALTGVLKNILNWLNRAIDEYDYSIALNPTFILSCIRQNALLGGSEDEKMGWPLFGKAINFNSFKLNIKLSGKIAGKDFMQLAELKGDNYFAALPDPNDTITCRLKWVLLGPDPEVKHMQFDLKDAKMQGNGGEMIYIGTKKWKATLPKLRIDFCGNGNDTAEVFGFHPDGKETWQIPKYGPLDIGAMNTVLMGCFMDIDRLKKETNMANAEKMKQEMMKEYEKFKANYAAGQTPSASQVSNMMSMAKAMSSGKKVAELSQSFAPGSFLIKPSPQNKNQVVFKERLNGKELFPQNSKTEYAWFDISLEQDPDSPYKVKL